MADIDERVKATCSAFQRCCTASDHEENLKAISMQDWQGRYGDPSTTIKKLFSKIPSTGWLGDDVPTRMGTRDGSNHGSDEDDSNEHDDETEQRSRGSPSLSNANEDRDDDRDSTNSYNSANYIDCEREDRYENANDLAWRHFKKAVAQPSESCEISSQYTPDSLDPRRMRRAMGKEWGGLKPFQQDGVALLRAGELGKRGFARGNLLFDSMGLGKTIQVIALLCEHPISGTVLLVMPKSLIDNWTEELDRFARPGFAVIIYDGSQTAEELEIADIVIVTYDRLRNEYAAAERYFKDMRWRKDHPYPFSSTRYIKRSRTVEALRFERPRFPLFLVNWSCLIFDEAQAFKNNKKVTFRACRALKARYRIIMTGTPLSNEYSDIQSVLSVLRLAPFDDPTWFKTHFVLRSKEGSKIDKLRVRPNEIEPLDLTRNAFLFLTVRAESIRRTRESFFNGVSLKEDIPRLHEEIIKLPLDDGTRLQDFKYAMKDIPTGFNGSCKDLDNVEEFFQWVASDAPAAYGDGEKYKHPLMNFWPRNEQETQHTTAIQWSNKLRDIVKTEAGGKRKDVYPEASERRLAEVTEARLSTCHWAVPGARYGVQQGSKRSATVNDITGVRYAEARTKFMRWIRRGERWRSTKIEWCVEHVDKTLNANADDVFIIACYSLAVLDVVEVGLEKHGIKTLRFDGTLSAKQRSEVRKTMENGGTGTPQVLLLTTGAGGVGLNLIFANRMIILIPDWSPAVMAQVATRIWRTGQKKECYITYLAAKSSMDERVKEKQDAKTLKSFGLLELDKVDTSILSRRDREFCEASRDLIEDMKGWDKDKFFEELAMIFVEEKTQIRQGSSDAQPYKISDDDESNSD